MLALTMPAFWLYLFTPGKMLSSLVSECKQMTSYKVLMHVQWTCGWMGIFSEDSLHLGVLGTALTVIPLLGARLLPDGTIQFLATRWQVSISGRDCMYTDYHLRHTQTIIYANVPKRWFQSLFFLSKGDRGNDLSSLLAILTSKVWFTW